MGAAIAKSKDPAPESHLYPAMSSNYPTRQASSSIRYGTMTFQGVFDGTYVLRIYDGLGYEAIGEIQGTPAATARSRMRYALEGLLKALDTT